MAATSSETDIPRWSSAGSVWTTTMTRPVADGHSSRRDDSLVGHIYLHRGDDSGFRAATWRASE